MIKFQPIARLNAIMVVSKKPALLRTAATWIKRLDRADTTRTSVHVYQVKYGDARQMAKVLTEIFGGDSSGGPLDSADSQIAPGAGSYRSASDRLSLNSNSSSSLSGGASSSSGGPGSSSSGLGFGSRSASGAGTSGAPSFGTNTAGAPAAAALASANAGPLDSRGTGAGGGQTVLQGVRITADGSNNTLLIYADQANYKIIESTLQKVDQPQLQVAIDATIAEVTLNDQLTYGVQFYLTSKNLGLKPDQGSALNTQSSATQSAAAAAGTVVNQFISRAIPGFNFLIGPEAQPNAILDALHSVTGVKVLSNPSLVVVNNQVATLQVGDVVPVSTGSATGPDNEQHGGQHHRLSQHRHHPAGFLPALTPTEMYGSTSNRRSATCRRLPSRV